MSDSNRTPSLALPRELLDSSRYVPVPDPPESPLDTSSEWTTPDTSRHGFYRGGESPLVSRSHPTLLKVPTYSEEDLTASDKSPFDRSKTLSIRSYDTDSPSELLINLTKCTRYINMCFAVLKLPFSKATTLVFSAHVAAPYTQIIIVISSVCVCVPGTKPNHTILFIVTDSTGRFLSTVVFEVED